MLKHQNNLCLLFDFDGTLVDSFHCAMRKAALLADEFNFQKIDIDEVEHLRGLSSKELLKILNIPIYKIPILMHRMRKHMRNEMPNLDPIAHIQPVIEALYHDHVMMGILTSNSTENVAKWLDSHNMTQFFDFVHSESNYFSKRYLLKKTLHAYKIDKSKAYYICDETRDIEAAKKNKIQSIAVTWGYNSEHALVRYEPSFIARHPNDILDIVGVKS